MIPGTKVEELTDEDLNRLSAEGDILLPPLEPRHGDTRTAEIECGRCETRFLCHQVFSKGFGWRHTGMKLCDACKAESDREDAERRAEWERERIRQRIEDCRRDFGFPPLFAETDPNRLPAAAIEAVNAYEFGPRGLGLVGPTGVGKTRAMMLLCRRLIEVDMISGRYVTATAFSLEVMRLGFEVPRYIDALCKPGFLFFDDLGKGKLTDAVEGHLFHIIDTRLANEKPVLFTANAGPKLLRQKMSADRGAPLIRRLKEFCDIIEL